MDEKRLDDYIWEWLEDVKRGTVKPLTYDRLLISFRMLKQHGISRLGVNELTAKDIQRYLNDLAKYGYSLSTIKKQFNLITAFWKWAMSEGYVSKPVYLGANLPDEESLAAHKEEIEAYSHLEQEKLMPELTKLEKEQYGVAVLALEAGLRVGEALALTWDDILWERKAVKVHRTLVRMSSEAKTFVQESPKSKQSRRTIPLSDRAIDILRRLKDRKGNLKYVFSQPDNQKMPYSYSSVEFHIRHLCKDLGIRYKGLHAFRHTFATNCYERGCDVKILSKLLGHADVAITYNIYIHLYGDALEEMRKVIG